MIQEQALFWNDETPDWETGMIKLSQSYHLKQVEIEIVEHVVKLVKVDNIDDLLDRANDSDEIPFWAELWPAAIGLARYIFENKSLFIKQRLLELGTGVGLSGIAAKMAGSQVTQSDFSIEALRFTQVNCLRNQVEVGELLLADWRRFPTQVEPFDWIIGADILYEKNLHPDLVKVFTRALKPGGTILLADPGRNYAGDFIRQALTDGWQADQTSDLVIYEGHNYHIDIYSLHPGEPYR